MGEGDEVSDVSREDVLHLGHGHSTSSGHGWLHRFINRKLDLGLYMLDPQSWTRDYEDADEESVEQELKEVEEARQALRNPEHQGEQISGGL
jgi:hypothetical protein